MLMMAAAAAIIFASSCGRKGEEAASEGEPADSLAVVDPTAMKWDKVNPAELEMMPVGRFASDWMALCVGDSKDMNAMTISWGGIGQLWNKPVVTVYVSSDRYTKKMMDSSSYFTVTGFPEGKKYKEALLYLGSHSRKDVPDKVEQSGLTVEYTALGNPTFSEGNLVIECRKIYESRFSEEKVPEDVKETLYASMGMHTMYIGEIVGVWVKE